MSAQNAFFSVAPRRSLRHDKAFSLVEVLVVMGIIGILSTLSVIALGRARVNARDTVRRTELNQIGRFLHAGGSGIASLIPESAPDEGDLLELIAAVEESQGKNIFRQRPYDPAFSEDGAVSGYRYVLDEEHNIAIYANLENREEALTLPDIHAPAPHGGDGVWQGTGVYTEGVNGTDRYYQVSN